MPELIEIQNELKRIATDLERESPEAAAIIRSRFAKVPATEAIPYNDQIIAPSVPEDTGVMQAFWNNFPVRRTMVQAAAGILRTFEAIPELAATLMTDPMDVAQERSIQDITHGVSGTIMDYSQEWAAEDALINQSLDQALAGKTLGEKARDPRWYAKNIGQTAARVFPELLSLIITKSPLNIGSVARRLSTKAGIKKAVKETGKKYLFDKSAIATRVIVNGAIEAEQTREELYNIGKSRGMSDEAAMDYANKGFNFAMPMNTMIYGISDTASRFLVAPKILKGLSEISKGNITRGAMRATGGLARNWAIETFLEELPQAQTLDLSVQFADGSDVNILDVYGQKTYDNLLTDPVKKEILAVTAWMIPLMSIGDTVAAFRTNPSKTKTPAGTVSSNPLLSIDEVLNMPPADFDAYIPSQAQLVDFAKDPDKLEVYTKRKVQQFISQLEYLTPEQANTLVDHIIDINNPVSLLNDYEKARKAMRESGKDVNTRVLKSLDKKIKKLRKKIIRDKNPDTANEVLSMFDNTYQRDLDTELNKINNNNSRASETFADLAQMEPVQEAEITVEPAPEAAPEVAPEVVPEVAPEVVPEIAPEVAPEVAPDVAQKIAEEAEPVRVKAAKRIKAVIDQFKEQYPDYRISAVEGGLNVKLPNGQEFNIELTQSKRERGAWLSRENIMQLSDRMDERTVPHEVFHMAEQLILNEKDYKYMRKKYGTGRQGFEKAARAYERYMGKKRKMGRLSRIFDKIQNFFAALADKMNLRSKRAVFEKVAKAKTKPEKKRVLPEKLFAKDKKPDKAALKKLDIAAAKEAKLEEKSLIELKEAEELEAQKIYEEQYLEGQREAAKIIEESVRQPLIEYLKSTGGILMDADVRSSLKNKGIAGGYIRNFFRLDSRLSWDQVINELVDEGLLQPNQIDNVDQLIDFLIYSLAKPVVAKVELTAEQIAEVKKKAGAKKRAIKKERRKRVEARTRKKIAREIEPVLKKLSNIFERSKEQYFDSLEALDLLAAQYPILRASKKNFNAIKKIMKTKRAQSVEIERTTYVIDSQGIKRRRLMIDESGNPIMKIVKGRKQLLVELEKDLRKQEAAAEYNMEFQRLKTDLSKQKRIDKIGERIEKAKTDEKERHQKVITDLEQHKDDVVEAQKILADYINKTIPIEDRGNSRLYKQFQKIAKARKRETKQKYLDKAIQIADEIHEYAIGRKVDLEIDKIIESMQVKNAAGRPKGTLTAEVHDFAKMAKKILKQSKSKKGLAKLQDEYETLNEKFETQGDQITEDDHIRFGMLNKFMDLKNQTNEEKLESLKLLKKLKKKGREVVLKEYLERKQRDIELRAMTQRVIAAKQKGALLTEDQIAARERYEKTWRGKLSKFGMFSKTAEGFTSSWSGLMNLLSSGDLESELYKSELSIWADNTIEKADLESAWSIAQIKDEYENFLLGLYGKKDIGKALHENKERVVETGISKRFVDSKGNVKTQPLNDLSKDEAMTYWMLMQQPSLKDYMTTQGFDADTLTELETFLGGKGSKLIQNADYLIAHYDKQYDSLNKVYKKMRGVNLPKIEFYSPLVTVVEGKVGDFDVTPGGIQIDTRASIYPMNLRSRISHNRAPDRVSAQQVFISHTLQNEYFKAFALPMREINSVFKNENVRKAIIQNHGPKMLTYIDAFMDAFARGGKDNALKMSLIDNMMTAFTSSVLAVKPSLLVKQVASFPAFAIDMPVAEFTKYMANPAANYNAVKDLKYFKLRWKTDASAIESALQNKNHRIWKDWKDKYLNVAFFPIKLGDMIPIALAGGAYFRYTYDQAIKDGKTPEQAHEIAALEFQKSTSRMQQSAKTKDVTYWQLKGGSIAKATMMFKTSQLAYVREILASARALITKRGSRTRALKGLAITGAVLPAAWTAATLLTGLVYKFLIGEEDDDEDLVEQFTEGFLMNALWSPFAGYPILGSATSAIQSSVVTGQSYRTDPQISPLMSNLTGVNRLIQKAHTDGEMTTKDYLKITRLLSQFFGVPSAPIKLAADIIED